jgi:DNA repair exonuclease SbcCD ATPase subunit
MEEKIGHVCMRVEIIERMQNDIDSLREETKEVSRLTTILEQTIEEQKEQRVTLKQCTETLVSVALFINEQKDSLRKMNDKIEKLDKKFEEKIIEDIKKYSFDILGFFKNAIPYVITAGIFYGIYHMSDIIKFLFK